LVIPSLETLNRLARALDVTVADLVAGDSVRELLFVELRDVPATAINAIRSEVSARYPMPKPPMLAVAERKATRAPRRRK
jgi:hypothetical protein